MERDEQMLTQRDVAHLLKVSRKTVERLEEEDPDFPRPIKVRSQDRYLMGDIRQWQILQKLKRQAAASVGPCPDSGGQDQTKATPVGPSPDKLGQARTSGDSEENPPSKSGKGR